jgi:hypothetical protein
VIIPAVVIPVVVYIHVHVAIHVSNGGNQRITWAPLKIGRERRSTPEHYRADKVAAIAKIYAAQLSRFA